MSAPGAAPTRVLAVRHGQTAWNAHGRVQGQLDIGLDDTGRWQARRLAEALADEPLAAVYTSDLARAQATARPLADRLGIELRIERGLRERGFGVFEGHTFAEIESRWPEAALRWRKRDSGFGPAGGETLAGFYERAVATAAGLAVQHAGEAIVLVTHGGVLDCLYRAATRVALQAPLTWQLGNAAVNRLLYADAGFVLVGWGDASHLERPAAAATASDAT